MAQALISRRGQWIGVSVLSSWVIAIGACSSSPSEPGADSSASLDGGTEPCRGNLSEVGAECPASFDGTAAQLPACSLGIQTVKLCGDLIALSLSGGYWSSACYYDSSTHDLVGAEQGGDQAVFCVNSFSKSAGRTPGAFCNAVAASAQRNCSDQDGGSG